MNVTIKTRHGNITLSGEPSALNLITCWLYSASHVERNYETDGEYMVTEQADPEISNCASTIFDAVYDNCYYTRKGAEQ